MQAYQLRVIEEQKELYVKLLALRKFVRDDAAKSIPQEEQGRLLKQLDAMEKYHSVLGERIAAF